MMDMDQLVSSASRLLLMGALLACTWWLPGRLEAAFAAAAPHGVTIDEVETLLAARRREEVRPALATPLANPRAYQIGCLAAAGGISLKKTTDLKSVSSLVIWNNSATPVYIGGSDVTSTLGMPICTDSAACPSSSVAFDGTAPFCLSSSGTKTVVVLAGSI